MENTLEEKILPGYWYRNTPIPEEQKVTGQRSAVMYTGHGGAKRLLQSFRDLGIPDEVISTFIEVLTDDYGWVPLSDVTIIEKQKQNDKDKCTNSSS